MSYEKFTVESIGTTMSGTYAVYTSKSGDVIWTGNFGFKTGDVVEWWNFDGYCPSKIIVNGIITWTEVDKKNWWASKDQRHNDRMEEICKSKGLYHKKYNPEQKNISS